MSPSQPLAASLKGEFVVFLIGARINHWWAVHRWLPVARAMPRLIKELQAQPELGFLGGESFFGRTTCMIQYWRSMQHLLDYSRAKDSEHLPVWKHYNQVIRKSGAVGIWHETYCAQPGSYENVYVSMPTFGLGKVGALGPAGSGGARARMENAEKPAE